MESSLQKKSFRKVLLNVLNKTTYASARESKTSDWLETCHSHENIKYFVDWFSQCVSDDNCITSDELNKYNDLKNNGDLVPEEDLDDLINTFYIETPLLNIVDMEPSLNRARKELEALESLEKLLIENEKNQEGEDKISVSVELAEAVSDELKNLDKLNVQLNDALENFADRWQELRSTFPKEEMNVKDQLEEITEINKLIDENINNHLSNDFNEAKPTGGLLDVTPEELYFCFMRLKPARESIIDTVSSTWAETFFYESLKKLESHFLGSGKRLDLIEFRRIMYGPDDTARLLGSLSNLLEIEKDCIFSLQIQDSEQCAKYLGDRKERLTKIENILRDQKLYYHALIFISKKQKVICTFQLEKLEEYFQMIKSYVNNHQDRMDMMNKYKPVDKDLEMDYTKIMMRDLNLKEKSLSALDDAITKFYRKMSAVKKDLDEEVGSFQMKVYNRLKASNKMKKILFRGPTLEMFAEYIENIANFESALDESNTTCNKINQISKMFSLTLLNEQSKKDCIWFKCLNDPENFISKLHEMEAKFNELKRENESYNPH